MIPQLQKVSLIRAGLHPNKHNCNGKYILFKGNELRLCGPEIAEKGVLCSS